jgi:hypothetical protein
MRPVPIHPMVWELLTVHLPIRSMLAHCCARSLVADSLAHRSLARNRNRNRNRL